MIDSFPMVSSRWRSPDGNVTVFITETEPLTISITIGKAGTSVAAWAYGMSELLNLVFEHHPLDVVIDKLTNITTHQSSLNTNGVEVRSTIEAVAFALREYQIRKEREKRNEQRNS